MKYTIKIEQIELGANMGFEATMRQHAVLLLSVMFCVGSTVSGNASGCKWLMGGYPFAVVESSIGQRLEYSISSNNSEWSLEGIGYHATAVVGCKNCGTTSSVTAFVWLGGLEKDLVRPDVTARQKALEAVNWRSWMFAAFDRGRIRGEAMLITFGQFKGWATATEAYLNGKITHDIIDIEATDGCASISLRIEAPSATDSNPLGRVSNLLDALQIKRTIIPEDHPHNKFLNPRR